MGSEHCRYKELWHNKIQLSRRMHDITVNLSELYDKGEPEEILMLIEDRQKIIDAINRLDTEIAILEKNVPELNEAMEVEKGQYRGQLELIKLIDVKNGGKLQSKLLHFKEKLEKVHSDQKMINAYWQGKTVNKTVSLFVDTKG